MSDEHKSRGLLTDLLILTCIVGLILAAIYFSGNWGAFMTYVSNFDIEARKLLNTLVDNVSYVFGVFQSVK
ncbi:MAG: hypothetical protein E7015_00280 [Alphaproteobacteria bacterium]|nr:hypothetical protein [Alphaproteobacteria bacterium]